ncbi:MAG: alanine-phosphoribitol ligase, partial [Gammaproteobacteria bacterium]|nr:alanine-phosphoribitol ligase [Gammaproteobacteria bacterium]
GVEYSPKGGGSRIAQAGSEVLLTAGAIGSPKLMLLSGLGPAAHLRETGIEVVQEMPG